MTETSFLVERAVGRISCLAEVEVTVERTGKNIAGIISNLSSQGCYVDTADGFAVGTVLRLRVHHHGSTFEVVGTAIHKRKDLGMGVVFNEMAAHERSPLDAWITELEREMNDGHRQPASLDKTVPKN